MHLLKIPWLVHKDENRRFEIYSVAVAPDSKRLASGGLDGKVRIWSMDAILAEDKNDGSKDIHRQLCSMSNHNGAVTVVRFSPDGRYLASGSDDRVVLIWERDDSRIPRKEFGSTGEGDSEAWVARKRLIGHDNDIQDLAWSPDGSLLATVGLDSSIIIWSGTTFEKLKRFDAHQSHVKGITFDPANKYFATASDDRTVRITRYHRGTGNEITFSIEATISSPFKASPLSTYFRKCSWSPDGSHIAVANATNGPVSTVAIINRGTWESDISLVGHEAPCEVATFCPRMFADKDFSKLSATEKENLQVESVIATAGQDKTLAVWNTLSPRPLLVAKNIADKAITDIAWTSEGNRLFASSLDGTILVAMFEENEFGYKLPEEENAKQLLRYGGRKDEMQIPESVQQISLEEKILESEKLDNEKKMDEIMGNTDEIAASAPLTVTSANTKIKAPIITNIPVKSAPQKVTITKDGKKRITPQLLSTTTNVSEFPRPPVQAQSTQLTNSREPLQYSNPSNALPNGGVQSLVIGTKRKFTEEDANGETNGTANGTTNGVSTEEENFRNGVGVPEFFKPAASAPASTVSQTRLAVPKVRTYFSRKTNDDAVMIEIRNGSNTDRQPTRIIATKQGQVVFADFLPRHGHLVAGEADQFWAVSTDIGVIYVYSPAGRRLIPSIVIGSALTFLESQGPYLLAVSCIGMVYLWNIIEKKAILQPVSLAPILDAGTRFTENGLVNGPSITQCGVTDKGKILISLNNGDSYTYSTDMCSWHRISEPWWLYGSQYWDSMISDSNKTGGLITMVERRTNEEIMHKPGSRGRQLQRMAKNRMLQEGYEGFEGVVSISHLENRIVSTIMLDNGQELQSLLVMYARRIAEDGLKQRLDELCRDLLGPVIMRKTGAENDKDGGKDSGNEWQSTLCSKSKHELLKSVLLAAGKYREVQSIVTGYCKAIGLVIEE